MKTTERTQWIGKPAFIACVNPIIMPIFAIGIASIGIDLALPAVILPLCIFPLLTAALWRSGVEYTLTTHRIVVKYGFLSVTTRELRLEDIRSINTHRSLFEILFNLGTLHLVSAARDEASIKLQGIRRMEAVKDTIVRLQNPRAEEVVDEPTINVQSPPPTSSTKKPSTEDDARWAAVERRLEARRSNRRLSSCAGTNGERGADGQHPENTTASKSQTKPQANSHTRGHR